MHWTSPSRVLARALEVMSFDEAIRHGALSSHEVKQDCIESLAGRRRNGLNEPRSVQGMTDHSRRAIINPFS